MLPPDIVMSPLAPLVVRAPTPLILYPLAYRSWYKVPSNVPVAPVAPRSPVAPVAPSIPGSPVAPVAPSAPGFPSLPAGPVAPS